MRKTISYILPLFLFAIATSAHAQFFGLGRHRNPPPMLPEARNVSNLLEDNSCAMGQCVPRSPLGYHMESWTRWPGTDLQNRVPGMRDEQSDKSLPESDIPDSLNETKVIPRQKPPTAASSSDPETGIDVIPSAPGVDDFGPTTTDPGVELPNDILPESDNESPLDDLPRDSSTNDLPFGDEDSPASAPNNSDDLDSLFPSDDAEFDLEDLQGAVPRRLQNRHGMHSLSHFRKAPQEPPRIEVAHYEGPSARQDIGAAAVVARPDQTASLGLAAPDNAIQNKMPSIPPRNLAANALPQGAANPQGSFLPQGMVIPNGAQLPQNYSGGPTVFVPQQPVYLAPNQVYLPQQYLPQYYGYPPQTMQQQVPAQDPVKPATESNDQPSDDSSVRRAAHFEAGGIPKLMAKKASRGSRPNPLRSSRSSGEQISFPSENGTVEFPIDQPDDGDDTISKSNPYR